MKSIGFVDYYISEWHANNYPAWIKEVCERSGEDLEVKYAYAEQYVSPATGENTDEWCERFGVTKCETLDELCRLSDYIVVLAPSNPEKHLAYAEEVLKHGKNTYIDKTFAPDHATASKIFELGKKYGTRFFSSSALRYSKALEGLSGAWSVTTFGGGSNFEEYAVHQAEMVIATLKEHPTAVRVERQGKQYISTVKFTGGRVATMVYSPSLTYAIAAEWENGETSYRQAAPGHFQNLIADMLCFFKTGDVSFDTSETLDVMKLREAAIKGTYALGEWIEIQ